MAYRGKYPNRIHSVFGGSKNDNRCIIVLNNGEQYTATPKSGGYRMPRVGDDALVMQEFYTLHPKWADDRKLRTQKLIDNFRGCPGEFDMLKGVLCVDHVLDYSSQERKQWDSTFDISMIAERMDEMNRVAAA